MLLNQFGKAIEAPNRDLNREDVVLLAREARTLHGDLERLEKGRRDQDSLAQAFGVPLTGQSGAAVYQTSDPLRYQMPHDPRFRPFSQLSVDTLRLLARSNDIAVDCISHLKREVTKVPLKVALKDEKDKSREAQRQLAEATDWLSEDGGLGGYGTSRAIFEGQIIDDLLIIGAAALSFEFATRGDRFDGIPSQVRAIDAGTIQPLVSPYGFPRGANEAAFTQWVQGVPVGSFKRSELIYEGLPSFARPDSPYFMSPTEAAAIQIYTLMRVDEWNRTWLTEGSGYRRWLKLNDSVTPAQAQAWMEIMRIQSKGNPEERHGIGVAPGEITGDESRKDQDFDSYEDGRVVRICGCYGVNPASIGRHGEEHKDDQEAALGATRSGIVGELLTQREQLYNRFLRMRLLDRVVVTEDVPSPSESADERSKRQGQDIANGVRTVNMVMAENGLPSVEGGDELLLPGTLKPLSQLIAPPPAPELPPGGAPGGGQNAGQENDAKPTSDQSGPGGKGDISPDVSRAEGVVEAVSRETESQAPQHKFSCVMATLDPEAAKMVRDFAGATIAPEDLVEEGFETQPHITLRYGLHTGDAADVADILGQWHRIRADIGGVSVFDAAQTGRPYDVVKLDVVGHDGDLRDVHDRLGQLPHTDSHPDYKPHITLAYVKAGTGVKYIEKQGPLFGQPLQFDQARFSNQKGEATLIDLKSGHQKVVERVLGQWERKSLKRLERGQSAACGFESEILFDEDVQRIYGRLATATTKPAVRDVFEAARKEVDDMFEVARMARRAKTTGDLHNNAGSFAPFWGGAGRDATTAAHFNGKNITVEFEDKEEVQKRVQALFQKTLSDADFKHLAGAPDDSTIQVSPHSREKDSVVVMVNHPLLKPWSNDKGGAVQTLEMGMSGGRPDIFYDALSTTGEVPRFGARMMGYTIEAARALGVGSITLHAAGKVGDPELSGWKAWARMGFDAAIPPGVQEKQTDLPDLVPHVRSARSIAELHGTDEGREFWKQHGESFVGNFDLNLKSFAGKRSELVKQAFFDQFKIKLG